MWVASSAGPMGFVSSLGGLSLEVSFSGLGSGVVSGVVSATLMLWLVFVGPGQLAELCPFSQHQKHLPSLMHRSLSSGVSLATRGVLLLFW